MPSQTSFLVASSSPTSLSARLSESLRSIPRERKPGVYYPSEAGYCLRKLFYSYTEAPKSHGDEVLGIFALGDAVHEKVANMLSRSPKTRLIANEKSYVAVVDLEGADGFSVSGRLDDLVEMEVIENAQNQEKPLETAGKAEESDGIRGRTGDKAPEKDVPGIGGTNGPGDVIVQKTVRRVFVVDVKSVKSFDYLDEPKREHVLQITFYLRVLREAYPGICGKLLYVKKEDFSMKEFDVPYDDKNWRELVSRLSVLHRTLTVPSMRRHGAEPESKFVKEMNWGCSYCNHKNMCDFDCGSHGEAYKGMRLVSPPEDRVEAFL